MKILVIQDWLRSGGTERQSVLLANAFAAAGHAATLLTFRPGGALAPTVERGVRRRSLQPFDTRLDWFAPGLVDVVARDAPDVILLMGRMANCTGGLLVRATQARAPATAVIATMRTGKRLPGRFRTSLQRVRHVIANSHEARDTLLREHRLSADRISVIHNPLVFPARVAASRPGAPDFRAVHGAGPATTVLLCVAMFRPEKNQRELIEIAAGLPADLDWQLWLVGAGPEHAANVRLAAEKGLGARIKFPGFVGDPSVLYTAADIAVHASASEGLSNFIIEAQAHGLPAIVYEAQGMRECFIPDRTGWAIPRGDRAAFRTAVARLAAQPPVTRSAQADAARAFARNAFDAQRQVVAHLELFQSLLAAPPP